VYVSAERAASDADHRTQMSTRSQGVTLWSSTLLSSSQSDTAPSTVPDLHSHIDSSCYPDSRLTFELGLTAHLGIDSPATIDTSSAGYGVDPSSVFHAAQTSLQIAEDTTRTHKVSKFPRHAQYLDRHLALHCWKGSRTSKNSS